MPSSETLATPAYTVWVSGKIHRGDAVAVLERIKAQAQDESPVRKLGLQEYVSALIDDAPYFVPKEALDFLKGRAYASDFDRALEYLAAMSSSGVRILARA